MGFYNVFFFQFMSKINSVVKISLLYFDIMFYNINPYFEFLKMYVSNK